MVRSRFLMQKCNIKTYGYHVYYFLFTKLKHYSVICGRVSREKGVQVSVKFSSVIHLTVDNYYLRGFGFISISV